jgi:hypothetical protein
MLYPIELWVQPELRGTFLPRKADTFNAARMKCKGQTMAPLIDMG